jgi:hypothetical protein
LNDALAKPCLILYLSKSLQLFSIFLSEAPNFFETRGHFSPHLISRWTFEIGKQAIDASLGF